MLLYCLTQKCIKSELNFGSAHGIQLTCCTWNPNSSQVSSPRSVEVWSLKKISCPSRCPLVSQEVLQNHKKKDDHNQNLMDPIPKTKNKKIHDTKVLLPRTPSLITGPASSGSRPDRITMRVESGWCDPKFHGFSKTQNKGNTSAHTYSKYLKIS